MSLREVIRVCVAGLVLALCLASLVSAQEVTQTNLVSDQAGVASNQDSLLINPFGIARGTGTNWMVSDRGSAFSTSYDGFGNSNFVAVTILPAVTGGTGQPTGVVFNNTTSFNVPGTSVPAQFLFATADGTIQAYNPNVNLNQAFIAVNNNPKGASYTGLTIAEVTPGVFHLYAANFAKGTIDVFDGNFNPIGFSTPCGGQLIPTAKTAGGTVAPYNVQTVGRDLVITYAVRGSKGQVITGKGLGLVLFVSPTGQILNFIFCSAANLNAPYGIAEAPADFGRLSHLLLIGNTGSGQISAFDTLAFPARFVTMVQNSMGTPLVIDGLHAFGFGATGAAGDPSFVNQQSGAFNTLVFTAGPNAGVDGLVGSLTPVSTDFVLGEQ